MKIQEMFNKSKLDKNFELDSIGFNKTPNDHNGIDDELSFNLSEDLIYFMHNNDDFYRKHFFPVLNLCKKQFDTGSMFTHRVFKPVVSKAYRMYQDEFPLRELKDVLDSEMIEGICKEIYETELRNMREGLYK